MKCKKNKRFLKLGKTIGFSLSSNEVTNVNKIIVNEDGKELVSRDEEITVTITGMCKLVSFPGPRLIEN